MIQQKNKEYEKKVMKNQNLTLPPKAPHTRHFVAKNLEGEDITLEHAKQIHYKEQIVQMEMKMLNTIPKWLIDQYKAEHLKG